MGYNTLSRADRGRGPSPRVEPGVGITLPRTARSGGDGILEAIEKARIAADACADKQAEDVVLLDIHRISPVTDYFVICTAETRRQLKAIYDAVDEEMSKAGVRLIQREGTVESGWILLDFGDVIVHVFDPEHRTFYQLERLWSEGTPVLHVQ